MSTRRAEDGGSLRGFARMEPSKQRELARKGGAHGPSEKRSFSPNRALAAEAGRKGGRMSQKRRETAHHHGPEGVLER